MNGAKKDEIPHETVSRRVIKIWSAGTRKEPVIVDLLRNGQVVDTVELSSRNNWRYEWTDLEPGYRWEVLERPGSYPVSSRAASTSRNPAAMQNAPFLFSIRLPPSVPAPAKEEQAHAGQRQQGYGPPELPQPGQL